jgi:hypothetical protein
VATNSRTVPHATALPLVLSRFDQVVSPTTFVCKSDRLWISRASWLSCFVAATVLRHWSDQGHRFTVQHLRGRRRRLQRYADRVEKDRAGAASQADNGFTASAIGELTRLGGKQLSHGRNDLGYSMRLSVSDHMPTFVDNLQNRLADRLV